MGGFYVEGRGNLFSGGVFRGAGISERGILTRGANLLFNLEGVFRGGIFRLPLVAIWITKPLPSLETIIS